MNITYNKELVVEVSAEKLELHYYFNDSTHFMNALVRNKCESELLAIMFEVANGISLPIQIDSEAYREGGLLEIWKILGENAAQISVFLSVVAIVASRFPSTNGELRDLQKQDFKLSIEEKKLRIEKLKLEVNDGEVTQKSKSDVAEIFDTNLKVVVRKSNFYKQLANYNKVQNVGFTAISIENKPVSEERKVKRNDFRKFILQSHNLSPTTIDDAIIEIVSPVLKEGRYQWKGIYENESIAFSMNDLDFKQDVLNKIVSFQYGSAIECVLLIHQKVDETGEIKKTGYSVATVIKIIDDAQEIKTLQGERYKFVKNQMDNQTEMFTINT